MKNLSMLKRFCLAALLAVFGVSLSYAGGGGNTTYYAKVRASVGTGSGTVYASESTTNNPSYGDGNDVTKEQRNEQNFTFYMYARAENGYEFTGWSNTSNGSVLLSNSGTNPYSYAVNSGAENVDDATVNNLYAIFKPLPTFYFSTTAIVVPNGAGTASVSPAVTNVYGEHWNSTSATTSAITFTATSGANHVFQGWSKTESGEIESSANSYKPTITSNSTNSGSPSNTTLYARFLPYPTGVTASPASMILGEGDSETINAVVTPSGSYSNIGFESNNTSVATVNANGVVTAVSGGEATITVKAFKSDGVTVIATASVSVSVIEKCATPVITFEPSSDGKTATTTLSTTTENASIYYTIDGGEPSTSSTLYTGPFNVSNGQTVRAITVKPGCKESKVTTSTFVAEKVALPSIEIASTGVSFSCETPGVSFYYTINGDNPTISLTPWNGAPLTGLSEGTNIKVIAAKSGMIISDVATKLYYPASGVVGDVVTLNDYEDHNWTYYSGVDASVDGGNYNTNYAGKLYSPNPRNVKITYNGVNGISGSTTNVRVSISENENSFVYYKTLEQGSTQNEYPYTVISNPFSVRPSTGTGNGKVYYGFAGWKIISGGEFIRNYNDGDVLPLDAGIIFENLPYPSKNCTSAEIVFETTWKTANRIYVSSNPGSNQTYNTNGDYESNFYVINCNYTRTITASQPVTIMMVEPDGSVDYRNSNTFTGNITPDNTGVTKIEHAKWNPNGDINARGRNFTIGRGMTMGGTRRTIYGTNTNSNINQVLKIESGTYSTFYAIGSNGPSNNMTKQHIVFGNDYDRAKGENNNLILTNNFYLLGRSTTIGQNKLIVTVKSGKITRDLDHDTAGASANCCYLWYNSGGGTGSRELIVEGGEMWHIAGGYDSGNDDSSTNLKIRVKGGTIHGSIYGGAAKYDTKGYKQFIFTGGTVEGWIAGGSNGYLAEGDNNLNGTVTGRSYVYVGGKTQVTSGNSTTAIDMSVGGNVYGAGCGNTEVNNSGRVTEQTNVVIADECYVQRGVYGGGAYGSSPGTANVYITGNAHVGGVYENTFDVYGGVYGGARAKGGGSTNIYMTGGYVEHGVYGGSNLTGTINNNVIMQIIGGQVGTSSAPANIHGGGYGEDTEVSGNVDITLGAVDQTSGGVTVYGDVYGGSALGTVNSDANDHTYVTMYKGTINGSLYGGGLGSASVAANVNGPVKVEVRGGSVKATSVAGSGGVYGANNINGAPQSSVTVDIYGTDPAPAEDQYALYAVYGGGNQADYLYGNGYPTVTVHGCDNSIEYVYGGGNAAAVKSTNVTIWGGNVIGNVFGGGHGYKDGAGADVEGDVNLAIKGGTIKRVFGGSNSKGNISGTINLDINKDGACDMRIGEVYGGGNEADGNAGAVTIGCTGALVEGDEGHAAHPENIGKTLEGIGAVYGGANNANVTNASGITLNINSGMVANVFGGNNTGGGINGTITVNVNKNEETCGWYVGNVFGGGNLAQYSGAPAVNILNGEVSGNVYGGGKGDANDHSKGQVTGNPTVTIGDKSNAGYEAIVKGDVYGGGDAGNVVGTPVVNVVNKCNTTIGNVYGGGNAADVNGTDVNIDGGTIIGMVFGGGHGDKNADPQTEANVNGNVNVDITGGTINKVFGGSNSKGNITGTIALNIEKGDESCELHITEVYGGGNEAAGNAGVITIGCTGSDAEGIGDVYGGANAADINTGITLNITGGNINRVFGGNNTSGSISGDIQVNVDWSGTCGVNALGNVYGAGNQAAYSGNTEVNILNGTVTGSVYGGGLGATAVVTGTTKVNIDGSADGHSVMVTQNVLGGGDAAAVEGSTDVNIINGAVSGSVFGGGNAAGVSENGVVDITGGTIASGVYGGSNASGTVGNTIVTLTNGTIGTDAAHANVHGGGYGKDTQVSGNVAVNIQGGTVYGDVYGGSALGTVNTVTDNTTVVNLTGGIIHGDAYGGGLGDSETEADVNGNVTVTLDGTAFVLATTTDDNGNTIPTSGRVFGCNNINGSPKGTVLVKVLQTVARDGEGNVKTKPAEKNSGIYELEAVYGGGNLAAYNPTNSKATGQYTYRFNSETYGEVNFTAVEKPVQVVIDGCGLTSIEYVYGGGNAAPTPATDVIVLGSYEIGNVFGGGNGKDRYTLDGGNTWNENPGADVGIIDAVAYQQNTDNGKYGTGMSKASVLGGTVHNLFGASNTKGNVVTESLAYVDNANICDLNVGGIYGGGNEAYMDGDSKIKLGCIEALEEIYGGARNADVKGDINLTISSGHFDRVFGGNNIGGTINGSITVTIEETGCNPITIGELYGCGNQAPYTTPEGKDHPTINLISFTSIGNVFGGGLGASAVVTGNPTVNINVENPGKNANRENWSYNGSKIDFGNEYVVQLPVHEKGKIGVIGTVYGGGNAAKVIGNTTVNMTNGILENTVFGGGNAADVEGNTSVTILEGTIGGNVYGGGNEGNVTGSTKVQIGSNP